MPFNLSWTGQGGGESLTVETAEEALREAEKRVGKVTKLHIKDDRGVKLGVDDLYMIVYPPEYEADG